MDLIDLEDDTIDSEVLDSFAVTMEVFRFHSVCYQKDFVEVLQSAGMMLED